MDKEIEVARLKRELCELTLKMICLKQECEQHRKKAGILDAEKKTELKELEKHRAEERKQQDAFMQLKSQLTAVQRALNKLEVKHNTQATSGHEDKLRSKFNRLQTSLLFPVLSLL